MEHCFAANSRVKVTCVKLYYSRLFLLLDPQFPPPLNFISSLVAKVYNDNEMWPYLNVLYSLY